MNNDPDMMSGNRMMEGNDAMVTFMGAGMLIWGLFLIALTALIVTAIVWLVKDMKRRGTSDRSAGQGQL